MAKKEEAEKTVDKPIEKPIEKTYKVRCVVWANKDIRAKSLIHFDSNGEATIGADDMAILEGFKDVKVL